MIPNDHIILFAHPRSGSSSLFKTLNLHPALNLLEEPFNENHSSWQAGNKDYRSLVYDRPSLDLQLAEIFSICNGFKLLDYQLPDKLTVDVLTRPEHRILFIRRRNLLQAIVSVLIAQQTQLWKKWEMERPIEEYYKQLRPLDIAEVQQRIIGLKQHLDYFEMMLDQRADQKVHKLIYEDLYLKDVAQQTNQLECVWGFLGVEPINLEQMQVYLRPQIAKINSIATYDLLPNAREIDAACSNDETGQLYS